MPGTLISEAWEVLQARRIVVSDIEGALQTYWNDQGELTSLTEHDVISSAQLALQYIRPIITLFSVTHKAHTPCIRLHRVDKNDAISEQVC